MKSLLSTVSAYFSGVNLGDEESEEEKIDFE